MWYLKREPKQKLPVWGWIAEKIDAWLLGQESYPDLDALSKIQELNNKVINTFDIDGVIFISGEHGGVYPGPKDVIITGRSVDETAETMAMLKKRGIHNAIFLNRVRFENKTREGSGEHKARSIKQLQSAGYTVKCHFEDDEIQAAIIKRECPEVAVVMVVHDLTNKENVRHLDY